MVYQWCVLGLSYTEVAKQLNVDPTTVSRTVQLLRKWALYAASSDTMKMHGRS